MSEVTFREGVAVRRKIGVHCAGDSLWKEACQKRGLDPKGIFHVSTVYANGFRVREMGVTVLWAPYRFDVAPPPEKTLEDYM